MLRRDDPQRQPGREPGSLRPIRGPQLDPGNAHDLMEVMDLMVSTRLLGSDSIGMEAATARAMQQVVWEVVTRYPKTGVAQRPGS